MAENYDVIVLGSGPGGYVAADVLENASGVFEMICAALHTPLTLPLLRSGPLPLPMRGEGLHGSADSNV